MTIAENSIVKTEKVYLRDAGKSKLKSLVYKRLKTSQDAHCQTAQIIQSITLEIHFSFPINGS